MAEETERGENEAREKERKIVRKSEREGWRR